MYNFLPEYQSAYRKFYSCETGLLKLVNDILWAMDWQQVTMVLRMDLPLIQLIITFCLMYYKENVVSQTQHSSCTRTP